MAARKTSYTRRMEVGGIFLGLIREKKEMFNVL